MLRVASEKSPPNAAVDARPEAEVLKQLARLEVGADERLFRVDRDAALEPDALRIGAAVYQKKDSEQLATLTRNRLERGQKRHAG